MSNVSKYIVLFQGRAGSTLLTEHMVSHPQIRAMYEEFASLPRKWNEQLDWMMNFFYSPPRNPKRIACGFKVKYTQIADLDLFANFVQDNGIRIIHLFRRNLVKLIVSIIRADRLRELHGHSNLYQRGHSLGRIHISPEDFRRRKPRIRMYRELREYVDGLNVDVCRVRYEDLNSNLDTTLKRIWRFIGVQNAETTASVIKNTPDRLEDAVVNLDQLRASFPEYERFFDDAPTISGAETHPEKWTARAPR